MIQKRVLVPDRVRHLPKTDWAWVDRRFLRDFAPKLSGDAVFLYYLLTAVIELELDIPDPSRYDHLLEEETDDQSQA